MTVAATITYGTEEIQIGVTFCQIHSFHKESCSDANCIQDMNHS